MASFNMYEPQELLRELEKLGKDTEKMMMEMTQAGGKVVYNNVIDRMHVAFKTPESLIANLRMTKPYRAPSSDSINTKVAVYGYIHKGKKFKRRNRYKGKNNKTQGKVYISDGVPAPFVVIQREFGNSRGEKKIPIFRPSFEDNRIESEMLNVQKQYIPED
nr:MAG TPA: hypothetical protein [Caudoviricetes sp.]